MKTEVMEYLATADLCGMTRTQCADHFGIHPQTLQAKLNEEDVDFNFLLKVERHDRVMKARDTEEAARLAGITQDSVYKLRSRMRASLTGAHQ